jgi:DNA transformation protein
MYGHAMASPTPAFVSHCMELLQALGSVRSKRMFGGWGLYVDDIIVGIIAFERLYLKVNEDTRPAFEAEGCEPFVYDAKNGSVAMSYWTAPADALDSPALMLPWARRALQAALAARAAKATKPVKRAARR